MRKLICCITLFSCVGCQMPGRQTTAQRGSEPTAVAQSEPAQPSKSPFSLGRIWKTVTFQNTPEGEEGAQSLVPKEVVNLGNVINSIASRAQELSVNDPPEVTKQKAQAILESLKPWDSVLAAGRSVGAINDRTAAMLNGIVGKLKEKVGQLVAYVPNGQTISAVKYLAGQLSAAYSATSGAFNRFTRRQ